MSATSDRPKSKVLWADQQEGLFSTRIDIARMLTGAMLQLPVHVLTGKQPGATLGVTCMVHGDEPLPSVALRNLMDELPRAGFKGRLVVVSVSNPLAMAAFNRQSTEQHGKTDMHEAFPGNARGNLTQRLAFAITENVLNHVDAFIDFHSGGSGGRLQNRCGFNGKAPEPVRTKSIELCQAFGTSMIQESNVPGSASDYINNLGIPSVGGEVGGCYLGPEATGFFLRQIDASMRGVMTALGMLAGSAPASKPKQVLFSLKAKRELRPTHGGDLVSHVERPEQVGIRIEKGVKLGEVIDLHSFEVREEIKSPFDGYLFFSRYSGLVEAGTQAFAVIDQASSTLI
jgi:predicted deacylase